MTYAETHYEDGRERGIGDLRTQVGEVFEDMTRRRFNAERLKTEAGLLCPDLVVDDWLYVEVKGANRSSCYLFTFRLQKYRAAKIPLVFVFWQYATRLSGCRDVIELRGRIEEAEPVPLVVPFWEVWRVSREMPETVLNYEHGVKPKPAVRLGATHFREWEEFKEADPLVVGEHVIEPRWRRVRRCVENQRKKLMDELGGECMWCETKKELTIDHVNNDREWSKQLGPGQRLTRFKRDLAAGVRLQILCRSCNSRKRWGVTRERVRYELGLQEVPF